LRRSDPARQLTSIEIGLVEAVVAIDVDIRVIQVLLGHFKLDTTALYARVATKTIRAVTSPLEHLTLPMARGRPGS
jgi:hypothetical protein